MTAEYPGFYFITVGYSLQMGTALSYFFFVDKVTDGTYQSLPFRSFFFINSSLFSIFLKFQATFLLTSWICLDLLHKHMTSLKQIQNTPSRTSLNAMYVYVTCVCVCVRGWVIVNFLWCLCLFACENAHQTAVVNVF